MMEPLSMSVTFEPLMVPLRVPHPLVTGPRRQVARCDCQGRRESTSVAGAKMHQLEGQRESWLGFWQGEREGDCLRSQPATLNDRSGVGTDQ
jgi:hypothetical protein